MSIRFKVLKYLSEHHKGDVQHLYSLFGKSIIDNLELAKLIEIENDSYVVTYKGYIVIKTWLSYLEKKLRT